MILGWADIMERIRKWFQVFLHFYNTLLLENVDMVSLVEFR